MFYVLYNFLHNVTCSLHEIHRCFTYGDEDELVFMFGLDRSSPLLQGGYNACKHHRYVMF